MRLRASWTLPIVLLACTAFMVRCQQQLFAQEARGIIVGKVLDPSGGVIPGASVEVTNKAMGTKVTLLTNDAGVYQASYLIPGMYRLAVEVPGFKKYLRDDLEVQVNDRLEVNIALEIGELTQTVTVTGETPLLNTASSSMGKVVDSHRVAELPTPHGDPYALIGLPAGVSFNNTSATLNRPFEPTHIVGYAIDGTRANRSDITIDGVPSTARANAGEVISSYVPPSDIVQEFKVQTATYDAQFGQTEGGVTNISIKSGTNALHGTAYYNWQSPSITANEWFSNATGQRRAEFSYKRWGGSVGGPVYIPKLYNGTNKTFFIYGYEAIREQRPRNNNGSPQIPTKAMFNGDFSQLLTAGGSAYQIYNPFTRKQLPNGRIQSDPFTGNIIPPSLINPVAKKIATYYPDPVAPGNALGQNNMLEPNLPETAKYFTHTIRIDHMTGSRQKIFGRASWYDRNSDYNNYLHSIATGEWFNFFARQGVLDYVNTLNSTTVLNVRYGYNRFIRVTNSNPGSRGMDLTTLGFPASYNSLISPDIRRFPRIEIAGYTGTAIGGEWRPNDIHSVIAIMNKAVKVHSLKAGLEFRAYRQNTTYFGNNQTGQIVFDTTWTKRPLDNSTSAPASLGQSVAAFLLGLPTSGAINQPASLAEQSTNWGVFLQDDWKVNSKLTLNLGLRWEYEGAMTERFDRSVRSFDYNFVQPIEALVKANYALNPTPEVSVDQFKVRGGLNFAAIGGQPRGLYDTTKTNFMPRFGFAYQVSDKTVLRGGYGIFFGFLGQSRGDFIQSGYSTSTPLVSTLSNGLTWLATLSNPLPGPLSTPMGASLGSQTFVGQSISFFNPNPKTPYMQRWQLGFQRELPGGFVVEMAYVGNRGTGIETSRNINALPNKYLSTSPVRDQAMINYLTTNMPNPFYGVSLPAGATSLFTSKTILRERLLRPFPQFDAVNTTTNEGYSWYHSMQAGIEKRFSRGYSLGVNYTWSKFMEATEFLNAGDPRPTKMISPHDTPHRLSASWIYELPFGKGARLLNTDNPFLSRLISGWQINGIYAYQTSRPYGFGNIIFYGDPKNITVDNPTVRRWFNTDAGFEKVAAKGLSYNLRTWPFRSSNLRSDPLNNVDLSITKKTQITEGKSIQFQAEFLNAFNNPNLGAPNTDPASGLFGQVTGVYNYARRIQLNLKFRF